MKNKMSDVRNHLVAMMELLSDENITPEEVAPRVERAKAMSGVAGQYINAAKVELDAIRLADKTGLIPASVDGAHVLPAPKPALPAGPGRQ